MATTIYPWLNIIAAFSERDQVIGYGGELPWPRLPKDMKRFRNLTDNCGVIMGFNTYKSLNEKPLSNRYNLTLTQQSARAYLRTIENRSLGDAKGRGFSGSVEMALKWAQQKHSTTGLPVWVIGGQSIYEQFLPYTSKLYLTVVRKKFYGDRHFPPIDQSIWQLEQSEQVEDILPLTFQVWGRK